jgi:hypothetical protein
MEQAVQLRRAPTQCNFRPLLAKNPPSACGAGYRSVRVWRDGFGNGLGDWKKSGSVVFTGAHGVPWRTSTDAPGRHDGKVAYAPDPQGGTCAGDADDLSGRDSITSPGVRLPTGRARRLVFQHYVATETGFDGGNVWINVNGRGWKLVPAGAWRFNAPNSTLVTAAEGNSNPMEGQPAFTGTDGGIVFGSWGTSIVDLGAAGAKAGDTVRLRFDMGRDGCGGNDGWYLDNVRIVVCKKKHHRAALGTRPHSARR